jgi:hypothetical protein
MQDQMMNPHRVALFRPISVGGKGLSRVDRHKVVGLLRLTELEQDQGLVWRSIAKRRAGGIPIS